MTLMGIMKLRSSLHFRPAAARRTRGMSLQCKAAASCDCVAAQTNGDAVGTTIDTNVGLIQSQEPGFGCGWSAPGCLAGPGVGYSDRRLSP